MRFHIAFSVYDHRKRKDLESIKRGFCIAQLCLKFIISFLVPSMLGVESSCEGKKPMEEKTNYYVANHSQSLRNIFVNTKRNK